MQAVTNVTACCVRIANDTDYRAPLADFFSPPNVAEMKLQKPTKARNARLSASPIAAPMRPQTTGIPTHSSPYPKTPAVSLGSATPDRIFPIMGSSPVTRANPVYQIVMGKPMPTMKPIIIFFRSIFCRDSLHLIVFDLVTFEVGQ